MIAKISNVILISLTSGEKIIVWILIQVNARSCLYREKRAIEYIYEINGKHLEKVYLIKDLGVNFTPTLRFNTHIDTMVRETNRTLGFIFRTCSKFKNIIACK